jgi:superoxide dismutase, Cu-Zn family
VEAFPRRIGDRLAGKHQPGVTTMTTCLRWIGAGCMLLGVTAGAAEAGQKVKAAPKQGTLRAVCVLHALKGSGVAGKVTFDERPDGSVLIRATITGLKPGRHGFHIHEFGDCSSLDGGSAGGHFNPTGMPHAGPDAKKRHDGDLGNVTADRLGRAVYKRVDKVVRLRGPRSIVGRAIIVHVGADDLKTQPTGNAGARAACGVIGLARPGK